MRERERQNNVPSTSGRDPESIRQVERTFHLPLVGPFCAIVAAWSAGIVVSGGTLHAWSWLVSAVAMTIVWCVVAVRRWAHRRVALVMALLCLAAWSASWATLRREHLADTHVLGYVRTAPTLACFSGVIEAPPFLRAAHRGPFSQMSWAPPETRFVLRLMSIHADGMECTCTGRLLVRLTQADHRPREGDRIQATGWLSAIRGPRNPGEFDFRRLAAARGIDARLTMVNRDNWQPLGEDGRWPALRRVFRAWVTRSLHLGLPTETARGRAAASMLDAVVLGDRREDLAPLSQSFRLAGLMHLLSISGAHLAILLGLTWVTGRLLIAHPFWVGMLVLVVLGLCLIVVPWRVPIVRASIMASVVTVGAMTGRMTRPLEVVALAAWIILLWQPADLYNPGFQLSFLCVIGLILWTQRVSQWFHRPVLTTVLPGRAKLGRRMATYTAANLVAYFLAMPLVAHHFSMITPYAAVFSLLAIPLLTLMLALAYLKLLIGLLLPTVAIVMASPLTGLTNLMQWGVEHAAKLPGATIHLPHAPSIGWTAASLVAVGWMLHHVSAPRWRSGAVVVGLCAAWLVAGQWAASVRIASDPNPRASLRLHALAVGDGSCYLVRVASPEPAGTDHVLMFDCGSLADLDVGRRIVVPALQAMGITRIDTLFLSHADLDHFCGILDVMDHVPVSRILTSPQVLRAGKQASAPQPTATAYLLQELARRQIDVQPISRGWQDRSGVATLRVLWPPEKFTGTTANDESLVLSVEVPTPGGARRLLLSGDVQEEAIRHLLDGGDDLAADVADLPHHGSFVNASPAWLKRVGPTTVLQSCGPARRRNDAWGDLLKQTGLRRFDTASYGMIQWVVAADGTTCWKTFHEPPSK